MQVTDIPLVRIAIRVLSQRLVTLLSLFMTFALSAVVMYRPTWEREVMAAFFAVAVFLPCVLHDRRRDKDEQVKTDNKNGPQE
ncbi:MAG: hypothetical protein KGJ13_11780 [Patescibacteria group bacterium]|nr:hypothetical protein [Patescibacteria group bacterium]